MATVNGQEHSGMIDMAALMSAAKHTSQKGAHVAAAPMVAPLGAPLAQPAPPASRREMRAIFAIAIVTMLVAFGTAAVALALPRQRIRGRVGPKARVEVVVTHDVVAPGVDPVTPVVEETPVVATPDVPARPNRPRRPRTPRADEQQTQTEQPRTPTTPRRDPNRPVSLEELMDEALR